MRASYFICCFIALFISSCVSVSARKIHRKHFRITLPATMILRHDTTDKRQGDLYIDTASDMVLIVSERESKFRSVDDYVNCSDKEIEQRLRYDYGDTALRLVNCSRSAYYPKEVTALHFRVSVLPRGYDTYMMYFIHHRKRDVQLAFIYSQSVALPGPYIDAIMRTMKLR